MAVIDAYPIFAMGIVHCLEASQNMTVLGMATSVGDYERKARGTPGVVILGFEPPGDGPTGVAAVAHMSSKGAPVLVTSVYTQPHTVVAAIAAGAKGFLPKTSDPGDVVKAVRVLAAGDGFVAPTLMSGLLLAARDYPRFRLTPRELEVLRLVASGATDIHIGHLLHISPSGVRSHLARIRDKSGRRRRAELTTLAIEMGLQPPGT